MKQRAYSGGSEVLLDEVHLMAVVAHFVALVLMAVIVCAELTHLSPLSLKGTAIIIFFFSPSGPVPGVSLVENPA